MALALKIYDEVLGKEKEHKITLKLVSERVSVRDLISARVRTEVENYNRNRPDVFRGLIQPNAAEVTLNGYKPRRRNNLDADKQVAAALDGFQRNGFFLLVDDRQVETLDEDVVLTEDSVVSFIKLMPLVGG